VKTASPKKLVARKVISRKVIARKAAPTA
jgi:hypothetical protein